MNEAIGKIRAALRGHDLLGAEAIELQPGAVVLVVLRHPTYADRSVVESLKRCAAEIANLLPRCVAVTLPEGFGLEVIEVADEPRAPACASGCGSAVVSTGEFCGSCGTDGALRVGPDEPFPWDAPAEGFGVATLGDPPSPPLAGYPVDRITSAGVKVKP